MTVSKEDLLLSGADADSVRVADELGGGYLVGLEVTHQLHCLVSTRICSASSF